MHVGLQPDKFDVLASGRVLAAASFIGTVEHQAFDILAVAMRRPLVEHFAPAILGIWRGSPRANTRRWPGGQGIRQICRSWGLEGRTPLSAFRRRHHPRSPSSLPDTSMNTTNILLEAGTRELEVILVEVGGVLFGVNVAKVREVILPVPVHRLPVSPPSVDGVFELRGLVVELIDLRKYLALSEQADAGDAPEEEGQILVTEFSDQVLGFRVDRVLRIERASWDQIEHLPDSFERQGIPLIGLASIGSEIVQMLDLESIVADVKPSLSMDGWNVESKEARNQARIVLAEDSSVIRSKMVRRIKDAGYTQLLDFRNGLEAWEHIEACSPEELPHLLLTDVEMPHLDGLHLCRRVREHPEIKDIPVILFSSLINDRTRNKGMQVGASEQISKPQFGMVVNVCDRLLGIDTGEQ